VDQIDEKHPRQQAAQEPSANGAKREGWPSRSKDAGDKEAEEGKRYMPTAHLARESRGHVSPAYARNP
jgi:hypothetical protein